MDAQIRCFYCKRVGEVGATDSSNLIEIPSPEGDKFVHQFCLEMVNNKFTYNSNADQFERGSLRVNPPAQKNTTHDIEIDPKDKDRKAKVKGKKQ